MLISQLALAAKKAGLSITKTVKADPFEDVDGEIHLSNGVFIQVSDCGCPQGVYFIVEQPEWCMWDTMFEHPETMTPAAVIKKALELKIIVDRDAA